MVEGEAVALFERFGIEIFVERPRPWQRGFWFDREPGRWSRLGLGGLVLGICILGPAPKGRRMAEIARSRA